MRLALLASVLTAGAMWLALGGAPVRSQTEAAPSECATCGQAKACPHGAAKGHGWHHAHRHEYKCVHQSARTSKKAADAMTAQFSGLGEEGWRLAKADNGFWCFMRAKDTK
ncbi:MAG: hypothetical protein O7F08_03545 [Deltaproteobacteria bacterium]|nr:hypothetical protein [Deltaproteobacteria bacterium]